MTIRVNIPELGDVYLDNVSDLVELKSQLEAKKHKAAEKPKSAVTAGVLQREIFTPERKDRLGPVDPGEAVMLLTEIKANMPRPTPSEALQRLFGVKKAKGFGFLIARVNKAIKSVGLDPGNVISKARTPTGRAYKAGKDLDLALEKLSARAK